MIRKIFFGFWGMSLILLMAGSASVVQVNTAHAHGPPASVANLAEKLLQTVVNISTSRNDNDSDFTPRRIPRPDNIPQPFQDFFDEFFDEQFGNRRGFGRDRPHHLGSGFVIDEEGIIITNNHVIEEADEIVVEFSNGDELNAEVIGTDPKTDIAVLKVTTTKKLTSARFGDSGEARIGDWVMAIGNPFGQGSSVSLGIISAINRDIQAGPYDSFIQTDAAINRGNSGGPLFNMDGEVIGINTAIISPSGGSIGLGFSIPSNLATGIITQLRNFGETTRGWLGVGIGVVTDDIAEAHGMQKPQGAFIQKVFEEGPAEKAGFRSGDVVLSFDGKKVNSVRDLPKIVADTEVNKKVDVIILRQGKEQTLNVIVGRLEEEEPKVLAEINADNNGDGDDGENKFILGMKLNSMTPELRERFGIKDDVEGVVIVDVQENSEAQDKGVTPGHVVAEVGQEKIQKPQDVEQRLASLLNKEERKKALILIETPNGEPIFVVLSIE